MARLVCLLSFEGCGHLDQRISLHIGEPLSRRSLADRTKRTRKARRTLLGRRRDVSSQALGIPEHSVFICFVKRQAFRRL